MLYPTDLLTYHYAWWRPGKYLELRCEQLDRTKEYWENYLKGMEQAKKVGDDLIVVRPQAAIEVRKYLKKIDIKHPKHIFNHPNYLKQERTGMKVAFILATHQSKKIRPNGSFMVERYLTSFGI